MSPRSRTAPPQQQPPLALRVPRSEARERIGQQIEAGKKISELQIQSESDLDNARHEASKWESYSEELLKRLFTNNSLAEEFTRFWGSVSNMSDGLREFTQYLRADVRDHVNRLDSIMARLDLIDEPAGTARPAPSRTVGKSRYVFVVHGHNEGVRESVCRFIEKLDLKPIVLHEQANRGKTIIEKFEAHSDVEFAVVLLTADDVGAGKDRVDKLLPRARQNVILELGYFMARIGRDRVCALYENGVEIPSDYDGVIYVPLDRGWQLNLAKEIKAAGIEIDLNRAV